MKSLGTVLLGIVIISATLSSVAPALALGGCGLNGHRSSVTVRCIFGGQHQSWCLRHTGHRAVRARNGNLVCIR